MNKDNSRSINILLCIAGVLCCIGSGFVTAPEGLLADESINFIRIMQPVDLIVFFAVPSALMIVACILVVAGKMDMLSLFSVLAGGVLFGIMDFQFGVSQLTYSGTLINMIGVILMAAAVSLQVFATETGPAKVTRKAARSRNPKEFRYERSHRPAYEDIYMDVTGMVHNASEAADIDTSDAGDYLALDTLKAEEAEAEAKEKAQKEQEDEIEALLAALSTGEDAGDTNEFTAVSEAEDGVEAEIKAVTKAKAESKPAKKARAETEADLDDESEAILAEMLADTEAAADEAVTTAMAHMAEALETPNKTMTDFYEGIEAIFLDSDN